MDIEPLTQDGLAAVAGLISRRQRDPDTHVTYLSETADAVASELAALEPEGLAGVLVAWSRPGSEVLGVLGAEHDVDPPRVWWYGPFAGDVAEPDAVADRLYEAARRRLPAHVTQEEVAADDRSGFLAAFAQRHGATPEEASAVLSRVLDRPVDAGSSPPDLTVAPPDAEHRRLAADLHDRLFPGTHSTGGRALAATPGRVVLVATRGGDLLGYAVAEVQAEAAGYLDYLGVDESARGGGVGSHLVAEACRRLAEDHGCTSVHLTVRASNGAARRLYERLGFREERLIRPWRKGFSLEG